MAVSWFLPARADPSNPFRRSVNPSFLTSFGSAGARAIHCTFAVDSDCGESATPVPAPGRVQLSGDLRAPVSPFKPRLAPDGVTFTGDDGVGIGIKIALASLHDRWVFNYWSPGRDPQADGADLACTLAILPAGDPGNPATGTALVASNCLGSGPVALDTSFGAGCPCTPADMWSLAPPIAGSSAANTPGTWRASVDFTDGVNGQTTPAVAAATFEVRRTPLVPLVHGWKSDCSSMDPPRENLSALLAIDPERFPCFSESATGNGYDTAEGVHRAGCNFRRWLAAEEASDAGAPIDIVAHSMGGLVARYALNVCAESPPSVTVHSVSMLGTPNDGVWVAGAKDDICTVVGIVLFPIDRWAYGQCHAAQYAVDQLLDTGSLSVTDMAPGSDLLDDLNNGFVVPTLPILPRARRVQDGLWGVRLVPRQTQRLLRVGRQRHRAARHV